MPSVNLESVRVLLNYTDWSNDRLLESAAGLDDEQLDREMQVGPGTMRRVLLHIYNGERVWYLRWRGESDAETKWPSESEVVMVSELRSRFEANRRERDGFLDGLGTAKLCTPPADLARTQTYRDSKGSLFRASLGDMLVQGVLHSKHHQAQAVNILRRLGGVWPELDYMYRIRQPA